MAFKTRMNQHRTNILINNDKAPEDDWDFIKTRGFKATSLLRQKIKELKLSEEIGGTADANYWKNNSTKMSKRFERVIYKLQKMLTADQYQVLIKETF